MEMLKILSIKNLLIFSVPVKGTLLFWEIQRIEQQFLRVKTLFQQVAQLP